LTRARDELGLQGIRYHGLLDDDMNVVTAPGVYNFTLIEESWKFLLKHDVKPIVELSFMPAVLANCTWTAPSDGRIVNPGHDTCHTNMQYKGIDMHPNSFEMWYELVRALVQHASSLFGDEEVKTWSFEVWNELWGMDFPMPYMSLYNASSRAIKSVNKEFKVGGPATAQLKHVIDFVKEATKMSSPFDFVSTHMYPTDDSLCDQHDNWNPDCLPFRVTQTREALYEISKETDFYLTEYNVGCCIGYPQHDTEGAAAFAFRTIGQLDNGTDVLSWWTFSDIFEEGTAVDQHVEYMNIYGLMTVSGVPKPGWRAFEMLHKFGGDTRVNTIIHQNMSFSSSSSSSSCVTESNTNFAGFDVVTATSARTVDECCEACKNENKCSYWTFLNDTKCMLKSSDAGRTSDENSTSGSDASPPSPPIPDAPCISAFATHSSETDQIALFLSFWSNTSDVSNRSVEVLRPQSYEHVTEYRIDASHANAYPVWQSMGSPPKPNKQQLDAMMQASLVVPKPLAFGGNSSSSSVVVVEMPPNSAIVLVFSH